MLNTLVKLVSSVDRNDQTEAQHKNWKFNQLFTPRSKIRWIEASALFFTVVCWGGGIKAGEASRLNKLVKKASSVVRQELDKSRVSGGEED